MRALQTTDSSHPSPQQQGGTTSTRQAPQATTEAVEPTDRFGAPSDHPHILATTQPGPGVSPAPPAPSSSTARRKHTPLAQLGWLLWVNEQGISADESAERRKLSIKLTRQLVFREDLIHINGDLDLSNCTSLTSLPEVIHVGKDLNITNCNSLRRLPNRLLVLGHLRLINCTGLTSLAERLRVDGHISLIGCTSLTCLPEGLSVGRRFLLHNCTSLRSLPDNLCVGRNLEVSNCTSLRSLPDDLRVGGDLYLSGCTGLTSLPEPFLAWPRRADNSRHQIFLVENTGLNTQVRARLEARALANPNAGIQLHFSQASIGSDHRFATLQDAWTFWQGHLAPPNPDHDASASAASTSAAAQPVALISLGNLDLSSHDEAVLNRYLAVLKGTQEAQQQLCYLAGRVANLAQLLASWASAAHPDTRSKVIITLNDAMTSCHDRIITGLDQVEQIQLIEAALHASDSESLRQLGQRFYKLQIVHEHAQRKVATLTAVDELEVYLKFEIALTEALALPIGTRSMLYESCASCVTQTDLDAAQEEATQAADNPEKLNAFLATWAPWQEYERKKQQLSPWNTLAQVPLTPEHQQGICMFTTKPYNKLDDPVVLLDSPTHIYSYAGLQEWYYKGGKHPILGSPLDLSKLRCLPSIHTTLLPKS